MIQKNILDRFYFVLLPALSLVMMLSLACNSGDEPVTEVVDEDVVVATSVVEPAVSDEPPAEAEVEEPVVDEEPPVEVEVVVGQEPVEEVSGSANVFEQDPVPNIVERAKTRQLPDAVPEDVAVIWEAFQFINDEYVDYSLIDHGEMSEEAILGFIEALGDPHMTYITPDQMRMSRDDLAGAFFGIGATVAQAPDGKGVIIQAPMEGSPAMRAGIKPGDRILAVDGVDATSWSVSEAVLVIRGEEGVPVVLTILHVGDDDPVEIEIIRGRVKLESVTTRMIPDTPFAEMDIRQFTDETPGEIREHMNANVG